MATISNGTLSATAELIAAQVERNLRREATTIIMTAAPQIQSGTPGLLAGQLTYLTDTLADALTLDAIYKGTVAVTLTTGAGADLNGLKHHAVGTVRFVAERPLPGRPAKWLTTVEIREVP